MQGTSWPLPTSSARTPAACREGRRSGPGVDSTTSPYGEPERTRVRSPAMETELAEDGEGQGSEGGPGEASDGTAPDAHHLQSPEDTIDAVDRLLDGVD